MQFGNLADQGESEAGAVLCRVGTGRSGQRLEDVRSRSGAIPSAGITDRECHLRVGLLQRDRYLAAFHTVLDCVDEQVGDRLLEAQRIAHDRRPDAGVECDRDSAGRRDRRYGVDRALHDSRQIHSLEPEAVGSQEDPRQIEHVGDEPVLCLGAPLDGGQRARRHGAREMAGLQQLRPTENRIHRRAQFVREHRKRRTARLPRLRGVRVVTDGRRDPLHVFVHVVDVAGRQPARMMAAANEHAEHRLVADDRHAGPRPVDLSEKVTAAA